MESPRRRKAVPAAGSFFRLNRRKYEELRKTVSSRNSDMYNALIIILTSLVSILCFTGTAPADKLAFGAYEIL